MNRFIKILYSFLPIELINMIHNFYYTNYAILCKNKVVNEIKSIDKKIKKKCFDDPKMNYLLWDGFEPPLKKLNYILYKEHFMYYFYTGSYSNYWITFSKRKIDSLPVELINMTNKYKQVIDDNKKKNG